VYLRCVYFCLSACLVTPSIVPLLPASNKLLGDLFCVAGAALYAASNVAEEYVVKGGDKVVYLAFIGLFGSLFSGVQL